MWEMLGPVLPTPAGQTCMSCPNHKLETTGQTRQGFDINEGNRSPHAHFVVDEERRLYIHPAPIVFASHACFLLHLHATVSCCMSRLLDLARSQHQPEEVDGERNRTQSNFELLINKTKFPYTSGSCNQFVLTLFL